MGARPLREQPPTQRAPHSRVGDGPARNQLGLELSVGGGLSFSHGP